jgi:hypothetical protein
MPSRFPTFFHEEPNKEKGVSKLRGWLHYKYDRKEVFLFDGETQFI